MKCTWAGWNSEDEGPVVRCDKEATHNYNCTISMRDPVCADHTCRCSVSFVELERRKERQRVPSSWMAL